MSLCCIGGVCIPYSALLPLLVWGLRWLIEKLSNFGLLPKSLEAWLLTTLQIQPKPSRSSACCEKTSNGCVSACETPAGQVGDVQHVDEWKTLLQKNVTVVVKCTASWCLPCKTIQPIYESLAASHPNARFVVMDVDGEDVKEVVDQFQVALLPTFLVLHKGALVERYTGSDENKLKVLIQQHVVVKS
jgi:thioredoxin 1